MIGDGKLAVAGKHGLRIELIIIFKHQPARAIGVCVAPLNHKIGDDAMENGVAVVEAGRGQALKHIDRVRSIFRKQHERHIADISHGHQASPVRRLISARRIRVRHLGHG